MTIQLERRQIVGIVLLVVGLYWNSLAAYIGLPGASKVTAAVYVYEKDQGGVPAAVMSGLNRANRELKITATAFEQHSTDGSGEVPEQYKAPLEAAKKSGLPALVVMSGDRVRKVVKDPKTEAEIVEAAQ